MGRLTSNQDAIVQAAGFLADCEAELDALQDLLAEAETAATEGATEEIRRTARAARVPLIGLFNRVSDCRTAVMEAAGFLPGR